VQPNPASPKQHDEHSTAHATPTTCLQSGTNLSLLGTESNSFLKTTLQPFSELRHTHLSHSHRERSGR